MKKEKKLYDEHGRWVEERARIKGAIRRVFRLSPQMKEVLQAARVELPPALKKDGTPGKKNQVRYRCAICGDLFSQKNIQVDHIETVVPLYKNEASMTIDELAKGIICSVGNLQAVCSTPLRQNGGKPSCHRLKTNEENFVRDYLVVNFTTEEARKSNIGLAKSKYLGYLKDKEKEESEKRARREARAAKKNRAKS